MAIFLEEYGIEPGQSSPYNPQSNGHAERNVKILKHLLLKTENDVNFQSFLDGRSQIRNTPRADGISPCQVVFGRSIRTLLPTLTEALGTTQFVEEVKKRRAGLESKQKTRYDQHSKELIPLIVGDQVWIQNSETGKWDDEGTITKKVRKRTYKIELQNGRITHRNRRKIKKKHISMMDSTQNKRTKPPKADEMIAREPIPTPRRSERIRKMKN